MLVFQPTIGLFGMLGNGISVFVLTRQVIKNAFNKLLVSLAVSDSIFIILMVFDYTCVRGNTKAEKKQFLEKKSCSFLLALL